MESNIIASILSNYLVNFRRVAILHLVETMNILVSCLSLIIIIMSTRHPRTGSSTSSSAAAQHAAIASSGIAMAAVGRRRSSADVCSLGQNLFVSSTPQRTDSCLGGNCPQNLSRIRLWFGVFSSSSSSFVVVVVVVVVGNMCTFSRVIQLHSVGVYYCNVSCIAL